MALDYARFVRAQDPVWTNVMAELTLGRKQSHWMWFVFPQMRGLGHSEMASFFGLGGVQDANDYVAHPILHDRLNEATGLVLRHTDKTAQDIFGETDSLKLRSSMTLFAETATMATLSQQVLEEFYQGEKCARTLELISSSENLVVG